VPTALLLQANSARSGTAMEEPQLYRCADVLTTPWSCRLGEPPLKSSVHCICVTHAKKISVSERYLAKEQMRKG